MRERPCRARPAGWPPGGSAVRRASLLLALTLAAPWAEALGDQTARRGLAGLPLGEALDRLREEGLALVFTEELVRPGMRVEAEPRATAARDALEELLAPHGLTVREQQGGVLVVVAVRPAVSARLEGRVRGPGGAALPGALVSLPALGRRARTDAEGRFAFAGLVPGRHALEVSAPAHLPQVRFVRVGPDTGPLEILLRPGPVFADEIAVRPSRLSLLEDHPQSTFALDREEIESLPHLAGDLFRATSLLPGVASNDVSAELSVHGGRADEVRILLDGQELYSAFHLQDYDNALSIVPASNLAAATLTTGALPASHGDRMSGVLDLRTVEPTSPRRWLLGASVLDALAASSGRFGADRGSWLVSARRGSLDLAGRAIGSERPRLWDLFVKTERVTTLGTWGLRALAAADELEVRRFEDEDVEILATEYGSRYAWLTHRAAPGDRLLVETIASWAHVRRRRVSTGSEEKGSWALDDDRRLEVIELSQAWRLVAGRRHTGHWGMEARRYRSRFDYAKTLDPEIVIVAPFSPPRVLQTAFDGAPSDEHLGLWASDRLAVTDRLTIEVGARWDRWAASDDSYVSPRLSAARRLGERGVLRAAWGRVFQSQRPYELQVEDGERLLYPAERSEHWVLGWEQLLVDGPAGLEAVRLELYRRRVDDPRPRYENLLEPLNFLPEIEPDRVRLEPERSTARGAELLLRGSGGERLTWWLAWTRSRAEDRLDGFDVPRPLDQPQTLTLDVGLRLPARWSLNAAWRYHTGWPTTPVSAAFVADPEEPEEGPELVALFGPLRSRRLPEYHRLDLRATRTWNRPASTLTFFVDVQNVYDRRNRAGFDLTVDEEEGNVELVPESWPGVFPSVGVRWEF